MTTKATILNALTRAIRACNQSSNDLSITRNDRESLESFRSHCQKKWDEISNEIAPTNVFLKDLIGETKAKRFHEVSGADTLLQVVLMNRFALRRKLRDVGILPATREAVLSILSPS